MKKEPFTLNKPIYVGNTVLELSKLAMYKFHYDFMKNEVNIFTLLYTDTDNSIYEIIGEDFYEIMHKHKELFDLSNQPKDGIIDLSDVKNNQEKFKSYLGEIKKGNKKHRSNLQKNTLYNIEML